MRRAGESIERFVPRETCDTRMMQRHLAAYAFVVSRAPSAELVLDFGCGAGYGAAILVRHCGPTVGLDRDCRALLEAQRQYPGPLYLCADGLQPPVRSEAFDVIVISQVLEHFADPGAVCAQLARMCRPGGQVFVVVPNELTQAPGDTVTSDYHEQEFDPEALQALLGQHFRSVELLGSFAGPVMARREGADTRARQLVAGDRLGLRKLVPAGLRQWVLRHLRGSTPAHTPVTASHDLLECYDPAYYRISEGDLSEAIDLVAVCTVSA